MGLVAFAADHAGDKPRAVVEAETIAAQDVQERDDWGMNEQVAEQIAVGFFQIEHVEELRPPGAGQRL